MWLLMHIKLKLIHVSKRGPWAVRRWIGCQPHDHCSLNIYFTAQSISNHLDWNCYIISTGSPIMDIILSWFFSFHNRFCILVRLCVSSSLTQFDKVYLVVIYIYIKINKHYITPFVYFLIPFWSTIRSRECLLADMSKSISKIYIFTVKLA